MLLTLKRLLRADTYTAGQLSIDGLFQCWTVEDKDRGLTTTDCSGKVPAKTAIPAGRYEVILSYSSRFRKYMPLLLAVPCFTGIRIHSGNTAADSEGCILVGREKNASGTVFESRSAFAELMLRLKAIERQEKIFIEIL